MNTTAIPLGTIVYVNWYGKVVPAEVIDRKGHCDWPPFADWIPVRMEIPGSDGKPIVSGCKNISMFHMHHVYATPDEAQAAWQQYQEEYANRHVPAAVDAPATVPDGFPSGVTHPDIAPSAGEFVTLTVAKQRYINFKAEHWDQEHNHLQVDALEEFYALWRTCIALKRGMQVTMPVASAPKESPFVAVDPGSPDGDHSATIIVDTETGEILPELPKKATVPAGSPAGLIPNPTKKQLRSTGRIQYRDTIQTSIFD